MRWKFCPFFTRQPQFTKLEISLLSEADFWETGEKPVRSSPPKALPQAHLSAFPHTA
jgi:hypothetical protein